MKYNYYFMLLLSLLLGACKGDNAEQSTAKIKLEHLGGKTMGTTFSISYLDSTGQDLTEELSQLLTNINNCVSTYVKDSEISRFNQTDSLEVVIGGHFDRNYKQASQVYQATKGWFNPTVMPLVNYWGFGYTTHEVQQQVDSSAVDSMLLLLDFEGIILQKKDSTILLIKPIKGLELDFSAIAKGDAVDEVGRLLESHNIANYFVEIGGEIRTRGHTAAGFAWRTGIRKPQAQQEGVALQMVVELENLSLATSGNYENYRQDPKTGQKYAHTINPNTGYPEKNALLSVSVFAKDCAIADAFATAFMAMGLEEAEAIVNQNSELEAYFIYADKDGNLQEKMTTGVAAMRLEK